MSIHSARSPSARREAGDNRPARSPEQIVAKPEPTSASDSASSSNRNSDKYQRILDAAVAVFAEKGFFSSRVADIADRADVADGTVYLYFKSKDEILMTAINTAFDAFMSLARTELKKLADPAERLRRLAFLHLDALGSNRNMAVVFQMELRQSTRFLAEFSHQHMIEYLGLVREAITEGQAKGIFRQEMSDKFAANCFFGALDEMVTSWVLERARVPALQCHGHGVGHFPEWHAQDLSRVKHALWKCRVNWKQESTELPEAQKLRSSRAQIKFTVMNLRTLNDVFFVMLERNSDRVMLSHENGDWKTISAVQLRNWVYATARQLRAWGIKKGDRAIILSENRPEWAIADFACLLLGIVDVPIYGTQTSEQCLFVAQNSEARIAFVSSRKQYEKIAAIRDADKPGIRRHHGRCFGNHRRRAHAEFPAFRVGGRRSGDRRHCPAACSRTIWPR